MQARAGQTHVRHVRLDRQRRERAVSHVPPKIAGRSAQREQISNARRIAPIYVDSHELEVREIIDLRVPKKGGHSPGALGVASGPADLRIATRGPGA